MLKQLDAMLMGIPRASGGDPLLKVYGIACFRYSPRKRG